MYPMTGEVKGKEIKHKGSYILAYGETTGHKHNLTVERPEDMTVYEMEDGSIVVNLKALGTITHEEHLQIMVMPGTYRVGHEREKDWFSLATRQVID